MNANTISRRHVLLLVLGCFGVTFVLAVRPFYERTVAEDAEPSSGQHYLMVFSAQAEPNIVSRSHSFALFVHVNDEAAGSNGRQIETHIISWMPRSLSIQPLRMLPEPGVNLNLNATLDWARSVESRVSMWGPFPIQREFYEKAVVRERQLESGIVRYLCRDQRYRGQTACNCIHAISDFDVEKPSLNTGISHGKIASAMIVDYFRLYFLPTRQPKDWLIDQLSLRSREIKFESTPSVSKD